MINSIPNIEINYPLYKYFIKSDSTDMDVELTRTQKPVSVNALDKMLAKVMSEIIKEKIDKKTYQNIQIRLEGKFGIGTIEAIGDFQKIDAIMREFLGAKVDALEKDSINQLISLDVHKKTTWLIIKNQDLSKLIFDSYGNPEKRLILDTALKVPSTILAMLESCKICKSSGYYMINELTADSLLIEEGHVITNEGKKVKTYSSLFENIIIAIEKGEIVVKVSVKEHILNESFLIKVLLESGEKSDND